MDKNIGEKMIPCPECDKIIAVKNESQKIGEFLGWLGSEKNLTICRWVGEDEDDDIGGRFYPEHLDVQKLLAEFFGIDLNKVEEEKRSLLEEIRNAGRR